MNWCFLLFPFVSLSFSQNLVFKPNFGKVFLTKFWDQLRWCRNSVETLTSLSQNLVFETTSLSQNLVFSTKFWDHKAAVFPFVPKTSFFVGVSFWEIDTSIQYSILARDDMNFT
jgi:hypothetical protein